MKRNLFFKAVFIVVILAVAAFSSYPPFDSGERKGKLSLGLDLRGGVHLAWQVDKDKLNEMGLSASLRQDSIGRAVEVIRNRIDQLGVKEPSIYTEGEDRIVVQLPGLDDPAEAIKTIADVAFLEFRLVNDDQQKVTEAENGKVPLGWVLKYQTIIDERGTEIETPMLVKAKPALTGEMLQSAYPTTGSSIGMPVVALEFTREGAKRFATVTASNVGKQLAILLDDRVISAPRIRSAIRGGKAVIEGRFTSDEVQRLSRQLSGGALPVPLKLIDNRSISPSLGSDSIRKGISAAIYGFIIVVVFMGVYYLIAGLIANFALCINIILLTGVMGALGFTLTLPGIAGIILTIGMAVDANVLIYERIREELKAGKTVHSAIEAGFDRAFWTIFDSNITTLITAAFLFQFGTGPVKGFAVTLSIGILASMFTALFVSRVVFEILTNNIQLKSLKMFRFISDTNIDFLHKRNIATIASGVIIVIGIVAFIARGSGNFGIDFSGGTLLQLKSAKAISLDEVRNALKEIGEEKTVLQFYGKNKTDILLRTDSDSAELIFDTLKEKFADYNLIRERTEYVGPAIGSELRQQAFLAILFALGGILLYMSWRFEFKFAVGAIVALIHDVLVTLGIFALTGREISLSIVAAVLTIVGYSLNDTIVIFDRVRENLHIHKKKKLTDILNLSINSTLSRTILTSLTTLFVVISLYFFGGEVINDFAFTLLVGIIAGTYSTIFIASPVLVLMTKPENS